MRDSTAENVAILTYKTVWFVGQAMLFCLLWNVVALFQSGIDQLGVLEAVAMYSLFRVLIDPPKLSIEVGK